MPRSPKTPPKVHNASTYANHACRCKACCAAATAASLVRRRVNREARLASQAAGRVHFVPGINHGETGYAYWSCRCDTCRTQHNAACARRKAASRRRAVQQ